MAAFTEQQVRDRLLNHFINEDPLPIDLQRPTWVTTAAGGVIQSGATSVGVQTFYFIPFKRRLTQEYRFNPQSFGEDKVEYIHYILIFERGTDIEPGDYFESVGVDRLEDGRYTVEFVSPREWDRGQAGILYRGPVDPVPVPGP